MAATEDEEGATERMIQRTDDDDPWEGIEKIFQELLKLPPESSGDDVGTYTVRGRRSTQEDVSCIVKHGFSKQDQCQILPPDVCVYVVCDGHGGIKVVVRGMCN